MKKRGFLGMVVACALLLLTSCLGDSNNQQTLSSIPGVISTSKDYKTIIKTAAGAAIYSPSLETAGYLPGQCVLASFTIDFDAAENANAASNGYYYATMNAVPTNVDRWYANPIMGDTTKLLDKEQAVTSPIDTRYGAAYLEGMLFLFSDFTHLTKQESNWYLSYDGNQTAVEENGKRIYSVFLRAAIKTEGQTPSLNSVVVNAFDAKTMIDGFNTKEKDLGNKEYYIKINYIKEIDAKDPTKFTWTSTDPTWMKLSVPADNTTGK